MKKVIILIVIIILGFLVFFVGKAYVSSNNKSSIENNNSNQLSTTSGSNKSSNSNNNTTNLTLTQTQINELSTKAMLYEFNTLGKKYMTKNQLPNNYSYGIENHFESGYHLNTSEVKVIISNQQNISGKNYYKVKLMYIPYEKYGENFATLDVFYIDLDGNVIPDTNANTILNSNPNSDVTTAIEKPLITPLMYQKLMTGAMKIQTLSTSKDFVFNQSKSNIYGKFTSIVILNGTAYYRMTLIDSSLQGAVDPDISIVSANQFVYITGNDIPLNIQNQLTYILNKALDSKVSK